MAEGLALCGRRASSVRGGLAPCGRRAGSVWLLMASDGFLVWSIIIT